MPVKRSNPTGPSSQKRTRFVSPPPSNSPSASTSANPDPNTGDLTSFLEEDLPQSSKSNKNRAKRQVKDQDGYNSDSSNENEEGVVPQRNNKVDEDGDVDMFGEDLDVEDKVDKGKGKGKSKEKEKEFMDLNDVEGQEFDRTKKSGSGVSEGDSDSEVEGEKVPTDRMEALNSGFGIEVIPFNMKGEMEEGKFTADGEGYVANDRDPNDKHDMWLEDMDKEGIKKARRAHRERERVEREREEKEVEEGGKKEKEDGLLREVVGLLERGETVLEGLQRLGKAQEDKRKEEEGRGKKKTWAERQKERKAAMAIDPAEAGDPIHTSNPFTNLSNIVSALTAIGHLDVYSLSRESIQRMLPQQPSTNGSSSTAAPSRPPADTRQFQYRFSMSYVRALPEAQRPVEREVFGPFLVTQLQQWRGTGFFGGPGCENVELRRVGDGAEGATWGSWKDVADL